MLLLNRFSAFITLFVFSLIGCAEGDYQTDYLTIEKSYIIGDHRDTGFLLDVKNQSSQNLNIRFYLMLPENHPEPDSISVLLNSGNSIENCSGLQSSVYLAQGSTHKFESCFFQQVASNAVYKTGIVTEDSTGSRLDSLVIDFPINENLYNY